MRTLAIFFIGAAVAAHVSPSHLRPRDPKPKGPVDPGISPYCTYYDEAYDKSYTCDDLLSAWVISKQDFESWNPAVGSDCKLVLGHSYCVEVNHGNPLSTTTTTTKTTTKTTTTTTTTTTSVPKPKPTISAPSGPSPTQDGLVHDCKAYYLVKAGDTCDKISQMYGTFSTAQFIEWNPAVGSSCTGLWADYYYCVGVPGTPTSRTSTAGPTSTKPANGVTTPQPTQPNMVQDCDQFVYVNPGDQCGTVASRAGVSLSDFLQWNPSTGKDCSGLWANTYACVGVIPAIALSARYHADCTGATHSTEHFNPGSGHCVNTACQVASLDIAAKGTCPDGNVRISYWEQPDCTGSWFGYGYASRGQCRTLWSEGWKFKSLYITCASKESDCVSQNSCTISPIPNNNVC